MSNSLLSFYFAFFWLKQDYNYYSSSSNTSRISVTTHSRPPTNSYLHYLMNMIYIDNFQYILAHYVSVKLCSFVLIHLSITKSLNCHPENEKAAFEMEICISEFYLPSHV